MRIIALDSSGLVASAAIVEDDTVLAEYNVQYKKKHSQTLLPMLEDIVKMTEFDMNTVDVLAVAAGPGSFTGLRIGSATVKGLGLVLDKKIAAVPTVDALAYNAYGCGDIVCPIMDARRNQVYTGIYTFERNAEHGMDLNVIMPQCTADFPELKEYQGKSLIVTDGTTLLGADDKAGVAEIMTMAEYLLSHRDVPHGKLRIGFTPDEEVGAGADHFDVELFSADCAYTVDGGKLGELEYENFNAAGARVTFHGRSVHPGDAKNKMKNALLTAMEFQGMLPVSENPMYTEKYEGFYHLDALNGDIERAVADYIIRDHSREKFEQKKALFEKAGAFLNEKYGEGTVEIELKDSYYNMKEIIEDHMELIDHAMEAMREAGVEPVVVPIRGGTDGARLSYMGLPCPNLCTGGHNFHGRFEYICIESMEAVVRILLNLARG